MNRRLIVSFTPKFIKMAAKLDKSLQAKTEKAAVDLETEANHKNLKVHKLKGHFKDKYSCSLDYKNRIVFEYFTDSEIVLLAVGSHDLYSLDL